MFTTAKKSGKLKEKPLDTDERARLRELEEENRRLKMERDFLNKAAAWFAKENFHSDCGSQYTGRAFRDVCLGNGIIPSVGQTGICFDNAAAESWNATFKKELIHLNAWKNVEHVRQASFEFAEVYYNRQRIQKGLGYLTPSEYELGIDTRMAQVA